MKKQPKATITDRKACSPEVGKILAGAQGHRVQIGKRTALIHINSWAPGGGVQYRVCLDFGSSGPAPTASREVEKLISELFPEEVQLSSNETGDPC